MAPQHEISAHPKLAGNGAERQHLLVCIARASDTAVCQAGQEGGRACWGNVGAYRLWSHVCRHTSKRCMKTCAMLQLRCSASHYTSQSLCPASTLAFWSEPPGGASYKVCPCGPGRDTRILLLQRRPHAVAQYSDSHTSNMLVHIFTRR